MKTKKKNHFTTLLDKEIRIDLDFRFDIIICFFLMVDGKNGFGI